MSSKKVVLVGHFGVGKSSLIRRFVQNEFSDDYLVTIGVHILKKVVTINNDETTVIIWGKNLIGPLLRSLPRLNTEQESSRLTLIPI